MMTLLDVTLVVWTLTELGHTLRHRSDAATRDRGSRLLIILYRIRVEEVALTETLGYAYRSYATCRKRLIPFLR